MSSPAEIAIGPLLIGWMGNLFLFGVATVQCYIYMTSFKQDRLWTKIYVSVLYSANIANTIFLAVYLYNTLIKHFSDVEGLASVDWLFATDPVMTGFIAAQVQLFFVWRVKVLTGSTVAALATLVPTVAGFIGSLASSISIRTFNKFAEFNGFKGWVITWLVGETMADLMITTVLVTYLSKQKSGFKGSNELIDRIIRSTVQTGAVTSIFATIDLILFLVFPDNGLHLIFNVPLAKLYTTMLMSSLNSRKGWQYSSNDNGKMGSRPYTNAGIGTTSFRNGRPAQIVVHVDAHEMTDRMYGVDVQGDLEMNGSMSQEDTKGTMGGGSDSIVVPGKR
ncbi:hypothetical protein K435DRAFT_766533 [Dendrothele bispora CBS 962.96]|uniref:DUF6534 domain-containing protein n=1 Tax=Dendrothele bispora (strain CBS 962.96) TaxID=1314807 RepID=A0A4S8L2A9_DENBC|nr:hypothetical protein K435DRAFT_766533 [Dendrothele bispora CBS 962.96]